MATAATATATAAAAGAVNGLVVKFVEAVVQPSRATVNSQPIRAKGGERTGPNPTGRGKPGSKLHLLCDNQGLPLTCAISATNVNDGKALTPLMRGIPAVRSDLK